MDTNNNQQRAGRQGHGGPARGQQGGNPGRGSRKSSPQEMIVFSPILSEMLLKIGATISVTFDGTELTTKVTTGDGDNKKEETLGAFLRSQQKDTEKKALAERLRSATSRLVALGKGAPDFSAVQTEAEFLDWRAKQQPDVIAALNMSSDNFRAHMRAKKESENPSKESEKSPAAMPDFDTMATAIAVALKKVAEVGDQEEDLPPEGEGKDTSGGYLAGKSSAHWGSKGESG